MVEKVTNRLGKIIPHRELLDLQKKLERFKQINVLWDYQVLSFLERKKKLFGD